MQDAGLLFRPAAQPSFGRGHHRTDAPRSHYIETFSFRVSNGLGHYGESYLYSVRVRARETISFDVFGHANAFAETAGDFQPLPPPPPDDEAEGRPETVML